VCTCPYGELFARPGCGWQHPWYQPLGCVDMSRAKRAIQHRKAPIVTAVGIAGAAVVVAVAIAAQLRADDGPSANPAPITSVGTIAPTTAQQTPTVPPTLQRTPTVVGAPDALRRCTVEVTSTEAVVGATRIAASHWHEHVQAQTDLFAGKNTEADTKAIWKRTRLAGPADTARLGAATSAQLKTQGSCVRLTGPAATACRQRMAALDAAATAGRAAAGDWARHLAMMAAHASGAFGPVHAQQVWIEAWRAAPKNLDAFARADAALSEAPTCPPS
jgi:hypothetical protein